MTPGANLPQAIFDRLYFGTPMENRTYGSIYT